MSTGAMHRGRQSHSKPPNQCPTNGHFHRERWTARVEYHCCLKRQKIFDRNSRAVGASAANAASRDGNLIQHPRPSKGLTTVQIPRPS